ncbi:hypothetical protein BSM4216_3259 [Bacillus smithii]|jgi:hypothetical protein|nr:hypothetical protein BSM4216_3259 [Bacillus smithii]
MVDEISKAATFYMQTMEKRLTIRFSSLAWFMAKKGIVN